MVAQSGKSRCKEAIQSAAASGAIIRIYREKLEAGRVDGYVAATSDDLFVLSVISDGVQFNGFNCFRYRDVTKCISPAPFADFYLAAIRKRQLKRPKLKAIDLTSFATLITTGSKHFPIATIHREKKDPGVCHIGRPVEVRGDRVVLREVTPGAEWEEDFETYSVSEITRVDFGGAYEEALSLVAGNAPD